PRFHLPTNRDVPNHDSPDGCPGPLHHSRDLSPAVLPQAAALDRRRIGFRRSGGEKLDARFGTVRHFDGNRPESCPPGTGRENPHRAFGGGFAGGAGSAGVSAAATGSGDQSRGSRRARPPASAATFTGKTSWRAES